MPVSSARAPVEFRCDRCAALIARGYVIEPEYGLLVITAGAGKKAYRGVGMDRSEAFLDPANPDRQAQVTACPDHNMLVRDEAERVVARSTLAIFVSWGDVADAVAMYRKDRTRQVITLGFPVETAEGWMITDRSQVERWQRHHRERFGLGGTTPL